MEKEYKKISMESYDYPLPDERIAKFPLPQRDTSKLLLYKQRLISIILCFPLPHHRIFKTLYCCCSIGVFPKCFIVSLFAIVNFVLRSK